MGRARRIKRILLLVLAINFVVAGVKIALGYLFAFGSLLSDGFHALSDGAANIVALVGNGTPPAPRQGIILTAIISMKQWRRFLSARCCS